MMATDTLRARQTGWLDQPAAYRGVRTRRVVGFLFDYALVLILCIPAFVLVTVLGLLTLGLGWMLYGFLLPLVAIPYVAFTLGGEAQATPGMRIAGIRLERNDGGRVDPALAVAHTILFWVGNVATGGFILLLGLFTPRKQLLQDLLLGTVVVRRAP
ncbi:RDD family protein [Aureimonas sp. AU4]|uniref:RDD family protein n=1 Tax=Aureimonas sp. AU4 TaxID=1638163 RepID=UPI000A8BB57D|nr:RDD family protein [Aureimonas sp. AU4]